MKLENLYAYIFHRGIKEYKYTINKSLKEILKMGMQNRLRNITMDEANKTALVHFQETETWLFLRTANIAAVGPHNEFAGAGHQ